MFQQQQRQQQQLQQHHTVTEVKWQEAILIWARQNMTAKQMPRTSRRPTTLLRVALQSMATRSLVSNHALHIYLVWIAAATFVLAASIQLSDGAALNQVGKFRNGRDRGK